MGTYFGWGLVGDLTWMGWDGVRYIEVRSIYIWISEGVFIFGDSEISHQIKTLIYLDIYLNIFEVQFNCLAILKWYTGKIAYIINNPIIINRS